MITAYVCAFCGTTFESDSAALRGNFRKSGRAYCTKECGTAGKMRLIRGRAARPTMRCTWCGVDFTGDAYKALALSRTGRAYCSKECGRMYVGSRSSVTMAATNRQYASARMTERNPMKREEVRAKVSARLKELGHQPPVRGGNGRGATVWQQALLDALSLTHPDWKLELVVPTGSKSAGSPRCYKIDVGNETLMLAIEVDGKSHNSVKAREVDARKTEFLAGRGWSVLRFTNRQVMADLAACVQTVTSTTLRLRQTTPT